MAITRVHSRLIQDSLPNVKDYGAVGDGVTNDSAVFESLTKAFLPSGNYVINSTASFRDKAFYTYDAHVITTNKSLRLIRLGSEFDESQRIIAKSELIAHRGFGDNGLENTMFTFSQAKLNGTKSIETDVISVADNVNVIFHDTDLSRLTNGTNTDIVNETWTNLQNLTFDELVGTRLSNERIPLFTELLDFCRQYDIYIHAEIKRLKTFSDMDSMIQEVIDAGMTKMVAFGCFAFDRLQYVRDKNGSIRVAYITYHGSNTLDDYKNLINDLAELGNADLALEYLGYRAFPEIVEYAHERGVDTHAWTILTETGAKEMLDLGINKIITPRNTIAGWMK